MGNNPEMPKRVSKLLKKQKGKCTYCGLIFRENDVMEVDHRIPKSTRLHQKIARQRKQFHYETAQKILKKADVVFVEDLSVKNMTRRAKPKKDKTGKFLPNGQSAKSGINKSIADAGWSQFVDILAFKAEKAGRRVVKVNPKGTSQHCSNCLNRVPKELSDRWHSCPHCGTELDRDTNAAILIKKVGLDIGLLKNAQPAKARKRSPGCTASAVSVGSMSLMLFWDEAGIPVIMLLVGGQC